ncbi:MAG: cation diffusion facilitator family transporter [Oscillospiraceae bacterium]|jgi:cation diffusion facilitator family transporter
MTALLTRIFIKDYKNTADPTVRQRYGIFSGTVGIILNIILFAGKFFAGILTSSISVSADAFNNLSDAGSSIISIVGFKMAAKPPDKEHPFGHGRYEYVAGFVISMAIILMAFEVGHSSFLKIIHPQPVEFRWITVIILSVSIAVKLWLCLFNIKLGKIISSKIMKTAAKDSLGDIAATGAVLAGVIIFGISEISLDAYLGIFVAVFILFAGLSAAKDTLNELLGEAPDKEFVDSVKACVLSHPEITGIHDMIVHNYGAGRCIISLHAEVPCDSDILKIHDVIDNIENEIKKSFLCEAVIHMDPIATDDKRTNELFKDVLKIVRSVDRRVSMHDFRIVEGETHTNLIFDVVVPFDMKFSDEELASIISEKIRFLNPAFNSVIQIDKGFVNE